MYPLLAFSFLYRPGCLELVAILLSLTINKVLAISVQGGGGALMFFVSLLVSHIYFMLILGLNSKSYEDKIQQVPTSCPSCLCFPQFPLSLDALWHQSLNISLRLPPSWQTQVL